MLFEGCFRVSPRSESRLQQCPDESLDSSGAGETDNRIWSIVLNFGVRACIAIPYIAKVLLPGRAFRAFRHILNLLVISSEFHKCYSGDLLTGNAKQGRNMLCGLGN